MHGIENIFKVQVSNPVFKMLLKCPRTGISEHSKNHALDQIISLFWIKT